VLGVRILAKPQHKLCRDTS